VYSLIGGQLGALIAFWIARVLGRPAVERFVGEKQLKWADNFFEQYGAYAIFLARLTPVLSVDLISYGAGASAMSLKKYFWASTLGQLPALLVYSLLGNYASLTLEYFSFLILGGGFLFLLGWLVKQRLEKKVKVDPEYQKDE